jgi:hypothetical protein
MFGILWKQEPSTTPLIWLFFKNRFSIEKLSILAKKLRFVLVPERSRLEIFDENIFDTDV